MKTGIMSFMVSMSSEYHYEWFLTYSGRYLLLECRGLTEIGYDEQYQFQRSRYLSGIVL